MIGRLTHSISHLIVARQTGRMSGVTMVDGAVLIFDDATPIRNGELALNPPLGYTRTPGEYGSVHSLRDQFLCETFRYSLYRGWDLQMRLDGKTALVTGAGRGIGKGCAISLAQRGASLVVNDRPGSSDLVTTADEIKQFGVSCTLVEADAFMRSGCERLVSESIAQAGRIDILVSNPAFGVRSPFLDYDPADFQRVVDGTLVAGFHISQLVARSMVDAGTGGRIVLISSVQAEMPLANSIAYGAAKAGLNHMMRTMSVELAEHRITVNAIEPGWTDTPGERATFSDEVIEREGGRLPWGRLATPADIGNAAAFLASDGAEYITGTVLPVDGGFRFKDCRATDLIPPKPDVEGLP